MDNNVERFLRIPEHKLHEDDDFTQKKIWIPDPSVGFRLCAVIDESDTDYVVGFRDDQGFFEKKRLTRPMCESVSSNCLADDLCTLTQPNAATVLDALTRRYNLNVIHTYSGLFCVVINPWKNLPIYTQPVMEMYKSTFEKTPPPHVYSVAQNALDGIRLGGTNQSILITGESGAGKTENTKRIIEFMLNSCGAEGAGIGTDIVSCGQLLEAFGNAATLANNNSSRFGKFIRIDFSENGKLQAAQIECYLLEKSRVVTQNRGERNFHIFYQLLSKSFGDTFREMLGLRLPSDKYRFLNQGGDIGKLLEDENNGKMTDAAMTRLGLTDMEKMQVYQIVSLCILIGEIRFKERSGLDLSYVDGEDEINAVASILGVKSGRLADALTQPTIKIGDKLIRKNQNMKKTLFSVSAMAKTLYEKLFTWILEKCNGAISDRTSSIMSDSSLRHSIGVLDIAGFEIVQKNSFEQFCINYTNEKLQQFFNHFMFVKEQTEYLEEGIEWQHQDYANDLQPTISIIEKPLGVFSLLEEECVVPNGSDQSLLEKFVKNLIDYPQFSKSKQSQRNQNINHFSIKHYAGQVDYNVDGWLEKNKDVVEYSVAEILSESTHPLIAQLFPPVQSEMSRSRKGGLSSFTVSYVYKNQLSNLLETLNSSSAHFIRCIVPNHDKVPHQICGPMVLHQLRCNGVLEGIRICRQGFPNRISFDEFVSRYAILGGWQPTRRGRSEAIQLCSSLELSPERFQVGSTKIFCKVGVISELEEMRKNHITGLITGLQAHIRSYLVEIDCNDRYLKREAVETIQENVRAFSRVADWSWFRLLYLVHPLIPKEREKEKIKELLAEREELEKQSEQATRENEELIEELERIEVEKEELEKKVEEEKTIAKENLEEKSRELKEIKEEMKNNEEIFDILEKKYQEQHQKILKMTEVLRDYERRFERLEMEKVELEKDLAKAKEQLVKERGLRDELEGQKGEALSTIHQMETRLERAGEIEKEMKIQMAKLENAELDHVDRAKRQSDLITELQKTVSELNERMVKNDSSVSDERNLRRKLERECERLRDEGKHTTDQVAKLLAKYDTQKEQIRDKDRQISKLEKKLMDKESLMEDCVKDLKDSHKTRVNELNEKLDEIKRQNNKLQSENTCQKMKLEHSDSQVGLNRLDREMSIDSDYGRSSSGRMSMSSHSALGSLSRQYSLSSVNSFSSMRTLVRRRETEPDIGSTYGSSALIRQPSTSNVMENQRKIQELERQLQDSKTEVHLRNREIEVYKSSLSALEQEKDSFSKQAKSLSHDVDRLSRELDKAEKAQQTLEQRLKKAQTDTDHWKERMEEQIKENKQIVEKERRKHVDRFEETTHEKELRNSRITALERGRDELQRQLVQCQSELDRAINTINMLEKNTKQQEYIGDSWETQYRSAMSEVENLRDENGALKNKIRRQWKQIELLTQQEDSVGAMTILEEKFDKLNGKVPE